MSKHLPRPAELDWDAQGQPISSRYQDVYFSRHNGLAESRYVFLEQNALAERWQQGFAGQVFYIGETGFGSGLNFLAAWQLWQQCGPADKRLHFISVENQPLTRPDLQRALALWPELAALAAELLAAYPLLPTAGFQHFAFADGRVQLTLIVDDASRGLNQLLQSEHPLFRQPFHPGMQAWFLDGFAPAKNPAMWQPQLFDVIADLSQPQASLATFSAAGVVKRELQRVGFAIEKRPGYGKKRDMLAARFAGRAAPAREEFRHSSRSSPHALPWHVAPAAAERERQATVIGAGLAGSHTARALAERGWRVTVIEQAATVASGASGNAQGVVYGKLSADDDALARFNLASLQFAQRFYQDYWRRDADLGEQCGVLQLAADAGETKLQQSLRESFPGREDLLQFLDAGAASEVAGVALEASCLYFPGLGWIDPARLCAQLLDHPNINLRCGLQLASLQQHANSRRWQLRGEGFAMEAANVVLANAQRALDFAPCEALPLKSIRGQVSYFNRERFALRAVVCADGYITPARADGLQSFGATFTLRERRAEVLAEDHRQNLASVAGFLPALRGALQAEPLEQLQGRTGFRCTTPDYLPAVGPVPERAEFAARFARLGKNARASIPEAGVFWPGLYLNVGHGSRGLAYTPLSAALLAALMDGDLLPVDRELATALNPARFVIRDLIRNKLLE